MPFSFASVRARTQDQRDILKWGVFSLPTELLARLVVRVLPISICPFGLGFGLSRKRKKRAWDMPLEPVSGTTPRRSGPGGGALTKKGAFFCKGPFPLAHSDEGWSHSQAIGACPMPFSFVSVRARTQDQREILKWGALSLLTELFVRAPPPGPLRRGVVPLTHRL